MRTILVVELPLGLGSFTSPPLVQTATGAAVGVVAAVTARDRVLRFEEDECTPLETVELVALSSVSLSLPDEDDDGDKWPEPVVCECTNTLDANFSGPMSASRWFEWCWRWCCCRMAIRLVAVDVVEDDADDGGGGGAVVPRRSLCCCCWTDRWADEDDVVEPAAA